MRFLQLTGGILFFILLNNIPVAAQTDSVKVSSLKPHSASKASLMSAVVPGLGQAYNKKYWKIPILYAGGAALYYSISFNQKKYTTYKNAYIARTDTSSATTDDYPQYTVENLQTLKDFYRRNRDLSCILAGLVYLLNILDASVDAHLYSFDVSDKLSMSLLPEFSHQRSFISTGMNFKLKF